MDARGKSQGKEGSSRMAKSCGETPVAGFAAESSSQLVRPLESQLVDPEEAKLESEVQKGGPVHEEEEGMKQCQLPTATSAEQQVPWFGFEKACTFVSQSGKNVVVRCNYCLPRIKNLRSAVSSSSNVKKHFERAHPEKLRAIEEAIKARRRGLPEPMHDTPPPKMLKQQQTTLERWGSGREPVTQSNLDRRIIDFIVEETLPLQTVDKPSFINLVRIGLPKDLTIICAKTLRDRIEKRACHMRETLANRTGAVAYIATTADCWTNGKKSYFGVTAHWINPTTLKREVGALAGKRLKGRHTYDVLSKALHDVHVQYRIHNKIMCTTTDNGSNFVKVFRVFMAKEPVEAAGTSDDDGDNQEEEEAEVEFVPICEILDTGPEAEEEAADSGEDFVLPPHQRCASHTLNLVATQDIEAMLSDSSKSSLLGPFKKQFRSLMGKCSKLWSKQNQSAQIAEYIRAQCGVYLKVLNKTRWNSTFDALKQLHELLSTVPLKMHAIMDRCSLSRITAAEIEVVQEYTEIMEPLAQSLDILQRENGMFMGYLLPTLCNLDRKLEGLENKPESYTYCFQLLRGVREALRKRFAAIWEDKRLLLAACLHPRFKLDWLESCQATTHTNKYTMEALLKAEIKMGVLNEDSDQSSDKDQEGDDLEDDFFNFLPQGKKSAVDTAEEELVRYLRSPSRKVSSLHGFPRVLRCFLQHNTGMPSSAAVERLFSTGGNVMTVKRHSLSDMLFEHLVLLRRNRNIL
ncbi:uncharacterized protein LOC133379722 [Rhineura floridana]|uniref:uncharacterized protein LOC133379722 n=1 Tax=Rhineura floridana TaxID=261503 RepID=UPI002AC80661|nr:uncharacterized protein LOC133379722 [Rhineura floridana]XP_061471507.1 uncharacterized protein LOC133379722 [Rhineura floridana]